MVWISALTLISVAAALVYGLRATHAPSSPGRTLLKASAVGGLTGIAALSGAPGLLTLALALGTLGDICLSRRGEAAFLTGLSAFLLGHLAYVGLLAGHGVGLHAFGPWRGGAAITLVVAAWLILARLMPHLGPMRLPVLVYGAVIVCMGLAALTLPSSWPIVLAMLGAAAFIASDAILGFELFTPKPATPPRWPATVLWFLYWAGQALILLAFTLQPGGA